MRAQPQISVGDFAAEFGQGESSKCDASVWWNDSSFCFANDATDSARDALAAAVRAQFVSHSDEAAQSLDELLAIENIPPGDTSVRGLPKAS